MRASDSTFSIRIQTENGEEQIKAAAGTLQNALQKNKIDIGDSCGGNATCGTCRVTVTAWGSKGEHERNELEIEFASDRGWQNNERLSCQMNCENLEGAKIKVP